ncbi:Gfo/Idh/MocA family protein [Humibacter ginsenosidimutans]|uniref:Gfo/Idh/MocA family oxidoreductase n=1 Tax=Humibacter ginsenosidimutans TaxID=2599293 RepID=A0A5B8M607_9MICO|nr:Gfo/Idh/MocA family oxidoreductase [Humibacter ginsenosidimutans]QDZ15394.1 Gfo/Idh/MocA family oxidoreductase [Humibacter ginsenosidimutans]
MTVAIVGPGYIGAAHAAAWRATGIEVSHLISRRADAALADAPNARTVTDLAVALADPAVDIVTICTPTPTHRGFASAALRAGKHVLLEKPMALSVADAEAIAREAEASGLVLMVAHVVRFFPAYARVRAEVDGGAVGHPLHVRAERMIAPPQTPWWYDENLSGGVVVDVGIHDLDQANLLLGEPVEVRATAPDALGPVETTVRYADGGLAQVLSHARMPQSVPFATALQVTGDAGMVATRHIGGERVVNEFAVRGDGGSATGARVSDETHGDAEPYALQAAHFLECVASGTPSRVAPAGDAVLAVRTALAARDSLRGGGDWVRVVSAG